jgi:hypothetical protein
MVGQFEQIDEPQLLAISVSLGGEDVHMTRIRLASRSRFVLHARNRPVGHIDRRL